MSGILLQNGKQAFTDANGHPLAGGKVYFYVPATSTPKDTWQDAAQTILNTNPITLDARGEASIYGSGPYRQVLKDSSLVQIWDAYLPDLAGSLQGAIDDIYSKSATQVVNIAALRLLDKNINKNAHTQGYYTPNDGGSGNFYYDAADTTSADNGGTIIVAADGARWKRINESVVSVLAFGAKGDNSTDDTVALQKCFANVLRITLDRPGLVYKVTDTITMQNGQTVVGEGGAIRQYGIQKPILDCTSKTDVTIERCSFTGLLEVTYVNNPNSRAIAILGTFATNLRVNYNKFTNFCYTSLGVMNTGNNIIFTGNTVIGPGSAYLGGDINNRNSPGVVIIGNKVLISDNDISGTAQGLILGQGSSNARIVNNTIHDIINEHGMYCDTGIINLVISGNVVRNTGAAGNGIKVQWYDSYGVTPENISITGNSVYNTGADGIIVINTSAGTITARNVVIAGNAIRIAGAYGIDARYVQGIDISGNDISIAGNSGIFYTSCTYVNVVGNRISNIQRAGIYDSGANSDVGIMTNVVTNTNLANDTSPGNNVGIFVGASNEHMVVGNTVRGNPSLTKYAFQSTSSGAATISVMSNIFTGASDYGASLGGAQMRYWGENVCAGAIAVNVALGAPAALQRGTPENVYYGTGAPGSGTWPTGAKVFATTPAAGTFIGWVCTAGGTPGTWKAFGAIAA